MTIQHIELRGERYVILPEREFLELERRLGESQGPVKAASHAGEPRFRKVVPLQVGGLPASEMLIRDRR